MPVGTDTYYNGNIDRGSRFGFTVGAKVPRSLEAADGLRFGEYVRCDFYLQTIAGCRSDQTYLDFLLDKGIRRGQVFIRVQNGVVKQIIWESSTLRFES